MGVLLDLRSDVADGASGCRVGECAPRRAIVGLGFPATHYWRTAQWRISQSEKDDGPNSDPSNSNQHSPHRQDGAATEPSGAIAGSRSAEPCGCP